MKRLLLSILLASIFSCTSEVKPGTYADYTARLNQFEAAAEYIDMACSSDSKKYRSSEYFIDCESKENYKVLISFGDNHSLLEVTSVLTFKVLSLSFKISDDLTGKYIADGSDGTLKAYGETATNGKPERRVFFDDNNIIKEVIFNNLGVPVLKK